MMRRFWRLLVIAPLVVACRFGPPESPEEGSCEAACENIEKRLKCDLWGVECLPACERVYEANAKTHASMNLPCLATAATCEAVERC